MTKGPLLIESRAIAVIGLKSRIELNALLSEACDSPGPFWCVAESSYPYLQKTRPTQPFESAQGYLIQPLRFTDRRARSGTPFRLYGTASVGSQTLTGIPRLYDPALTQK
jgi:hypothetical protein